MSLDESKRLYRQGKQRLAAGDSQGAIVKLKQALYFHPNNQSALSLIGNVMNNNGDFAEASLYLEKAIKLKPDDSISCCNLGYAFWHLRQYQNAILNYEKSIEINPNFPNSHCGMGNVLRDLGQYQKAVNSYEEAIRIDPDYYYSYNGLGNALQGLGQCEAAIENYEQAINFDPLDALPYNGFGNALQELERYEAAIEKYKQAIGLDPTYSAPYNGLGNALQGLGQYEAAIESYKQAIGLDPTYFTPYNGLGNTFQKLGRYEEAVDNYQKSIKLDSTYCYAYNGLGNALQELERCEEAIENYKQAIGLDPTYFAPYNGLGNIFQKLGRYEEAVDNYQKVIAINPTDYSAHTGLGNVLYGLARNYEALLCYKKAIEIQPEFCNAYNQSGNISYDLRDYKKAIIGYEKAIGIHPECPNPWRGKANSIWASQGVDWAITFCDQSILKLQAKGLEFQSAIGNLHLLKGDAHYQQGKQQQQKFISSFNKSANSYQAAIKIFEEISDKESYLMALQSLVKVLMGLKRSEDADEQRRKGTDYLKRLLDEISSPARCKALALKFTGFDQLTVDRHIQAASQLEDEDAINAKLKEAWETAEKGKNTCLSWLLDALSDNISNPGYEAVQQLLSPGTAIVYWHISPAALTTFILKFGKVAPIPITQPSTGDRPASLQQLIKLEAWMKEWDDQYSDYRNKGKEQRDANHSWRKDMAKRLFERQEDPGNLKDILNVDAIEDYLDDINHLILIPHQNLHRFPLHALFNSWVVVSYLPSLQVGLNLKGRKPMHTNHLLSIENPTSDRGNPLEFARVESQLISQTFQTVSFIQETDATQETVMSALTGNYNTFHFSGHGSHDSEKPQRSELLLAGTDGLTLREICQSDLSGYDLVSLSACETGVTTHQSITTEYVGLVSGFLYSGVAQIISTLWVVESAVSALVMIEFYHRRPTSQSDVMALAETIHWLRSLDRERFQAWHAERLQELSLDLPRERRLKIKRTLDHALARWGTIESDIKNPYSWAPFILSGGFFS